VIWGEELGFLLREINQFFIGCVVVVALEGLTVEKVGVVILIV
jgi:hypothetical protein